MRSAFARGASTLWLVASSGCVELTPGYVDTDGSGGETTTGSTSTSIGTTDPSASGPSTTGSTTTTSSTSTSDPTTTTTTSTSGSGSTGDPSGTSTGDSSSSSTGDPVCGTQEVLADNPVLYWRLGETSGTVVNDVTANGQDGTYTGVTLGVPGIAWDGDTAVEFVGDLTSYVQLMPVGAFPTTELTVEFWVQILGDGNNDGFFSYASDVTDNEIYVDDATEIDLMVSDVNLLTNVSVADGDWHHVAVTWRSSDGRGRLFVDGVLGQLGNNQAMGAVINGAGSLVLGQDQDSLGGGFEVTQSLHGRLDELIVFDQDLDPARIEAHRTTIDCVP